MVYLFAFTLFLSSTLMFLVQPMVAKMVLPLLGGAPSVWNTCIVFFQATLLAGYLYVYASTRWLRPRQQVWLHLTLLAASLLALPLALAAHDRPPATGLPILWLLRVLMFTTGIPFFVVSTSSPLLQRWFARTNHRSAQDPYFLSVAGNIGSVVALLAYPAAVEPALRLADQSWLWTSGYAVFVALTLACYWFAKTKARTATPAVDQGRSISAANLVEGDAGRVPTMRQRVRWVGLAFVPSSLMLGVTTFLTTDVATVPLFWIVPLAIYLLTFVLVFSRRVVLPHASMVRALPLLALVLATIIVFAGQLPPALQSPMHLVTFFVAAMVCHGELARARPTGTHLTAFYLSMSLGGVLGGLFNALVAPLAFKSVVEYPLAIVLACAARPRPEGSRPTAWARRLDVAVPVLFGGFVLALMFAFGGREARDPVAIALLYIVPSVLCFSLARHPLRFALSLGALMVASSLYVSAHEQVPFRGRSFFGVYRVVDDADRRLRLLVHGRTIHGAQSLDSARCREPLTYYHRSGPIGQAFASFRGEHSKPRVAIVGLGIGSLAAYGLRGQQWTFYEIDPSIAALARDARYFTFVRDSQADVRIVLGDARISLTNEPSSNVDLLVVDAFSSDAIPVHLITREALGLYWQALDPHGLLAFHISNRYLDFQPLLGDLARDAGLVSLAQDDFELDKADESGGKTPSRWVLMARSADALGLLANDTRWHPLSAQVRPVVWTDDFSNPLALVKWYK